MKVLVISDSHGNIENLKHVVGFGKKIEVEAIIHCGDWNTIQSIEVVLQSRIPLYTVLGNADINEEIGDRLMVLGKKHFNSDFLEFRIDKLKIGICHLIENCKLKIENLDIVFTGHYHSQKEWEINGTRIVRPGALENDVNFAIYDTISNKVEFINEQI